MALIQVYSAKLRRAFFILSILLLGMTCGILILAYVLAGDLYEYQDTVDGVHLPKVDAIVCLAGGKGRIAASGDIWYRYWEQARNQTLGQKTQVASGKALGPLPEIKPPILYLSGMGHQSTWGVVTRQIRRGVVEVLRPDDVVLEKESFNTDTNARWVARYSRQHNWEKILLVTSPYHMKRARFIFENILKASGKPLGVETLSIFQEPFEPGEWRSSFLGVRVTMMEYLKWIYYKYTWRPHPEG